MPSSVSIFGNLKRREKKFLLKFNIGKPYKELETPEKCKINLRKCLPNDFIRLLSCEIESCGKRQNSHRRRCR